MKPTFNDLWLNKSIHEDAKDEWFDKSKHININLILEERRGDVTFEIIQCTDGFMVRITDYEGSTIWDSDKRSDFNKTREDAIEQLNKISNNISLIRKLLETEV